MDHEDAVNFMMLRDKMPYCRRMDKAFGFPSSDEMVKFLF